MEDKWREVRRQIPQVTDAHRCVRGCSTTTVLPWQRVAGPSRYHAAEYARGRFWKHIRWWPKPAGALAWDDQMTCQTELELEPHWIQP